jgi:ABC-type branched-subunit amino acid transport system ATPase component
MADNGAPLLRARGVTRRFGGLAAVSEVSLDLAEGEIHAVIGTNGAGKSTLINVLAGEIAITGGSVELLGIDVTHWPQPKRAQAGLGRSYQRTTIFPRFSVFENCRLAAQATHQVPWNWWTAARFQEARQRHPTLWIASALPASLSVSRVRFRTARNGSSKSRCASRPRLKCCCSTSHSPAWAPRKRTECSACSRR